MDSETRNGPGWATPGTVSQSLVYARRSARPGTVAFQMKELPDDGLAWVSAPAGADERVLQVARLYNEELAAGSRSPAVVAADAVHISRAQVARYIRRARAAGLIPPVDQVIRKRPPGSR